VLKWIFALPLTVLNKTKQDRQYVPFISLLIIGHGWSEKFKLSSSLSCDKITFISLFASQSYLAIISKPNVETDLLNKRFSLAVSLGMNSQMNEFVFMLTIAINCSHFAVLFVQQRGLFINYCAHRISMKGNG
jgi:hypothetical protein